MAHSSRIHPSIKAIYRVIAFHILLLILLLLAFKKDTASLHTALSSLRQPRPLPPIQLKRRQLPTPVSSAPQYAPALPHTTQQTQESPAAETSDAAPTVPMQPAPSPQRQDSPVPRGTPSPKERARPTPENAEIKKERHIHAWEKLTKAIAEPSQKPPTATKKTKQAAHREALQELYHAAQTSHPPGNRVEKDGIETVIELTRRINASFQETILSRYITEAYYDICNALNRNSFYPREEDAAYRCVIYLTIDRHGTIIHIDTEKECASLATNEVCEYFTKTMHMMGKFRALPQSYEHETFTLPIPIDGRPAYQGNSRARVREPLTFYLR